MAIILGNLGKSAAVSTIALALAGCGGGSGGVSFIPPPPMQTPTPTPTPTPHATGLAVISAPARGSTGAGLIPIFATVGGPNFTTPLAGQVLPMLQTTVVLDATSIKPDASLNSAGGIVTASPNSISIEIGVFSAQPDASGYSDLDWTRVGYWSTGDIWDYWEDVVRHRGVFVAGYETPGSAMPTSGSATYSGNASGSVFYPVAQGSGAGPCNCDETYVSGTGTLTANFGTRVLAGSLTGMMTQRPGDDGRVPWNDIAFTGTITGNGFSGDSRVTTSPSGYASLGSGATGTLEGKFFGPHAEEAGAVWTLFDGTNAAIGTLTGKRP